MRRLWVEALLGEGRGGGGSGAATAPCAGVRARRAGGIRTAAGNGFQLGVVSSGPGRAVQVGQNIDSEARSGPPWAEVRAAAGGRTGRDPKNRARSARARALPGPALCTGRTAAPVRPGCAGSADPAESAPAGPADRIQEDISPFLRRESALVRAASPPKKPGSAPAVLGETRTAAARCAARGREVAAPRGRVKNRRRRGGAGGGRRRRADGPGAARGVAGHVRFNRALASRGVAGERALLFAVTCLFASGLRKGILDRG